MLISHHPVGTRQLLTGRIRLDLAPLVVIILELGTRRCVWTRHHVRSVVGVVLYRVGKETMRNGNRPAKTDIWVLSIYPRTVDGRIARISTKE